MKDLSGPTQVGSHSLRFKIDTPDQLISVARSEPVRKDGPLTVVATQHWFQILFFYLFFWWEHWFHYCVDNRDLPI